MTTRFAYTKEALDFIATGAARETSPEIMEAIAFHARDAREAEDLWTGEGFGRICTPLDLWETVTKNGLRDTTDFVWGVSGVDWWSAIQ